MMRNVVLALFLLGCAGSEPEDSDSIPGDSESQDSMDSESMDSESDAEDSESDTSGSEAMATIVAAGPGSLSWDGGSCEDATCAVSLPEGTELSVTATGAVATDRIASWGGACAETVGSTCVVTVSGEISIDVAFESAAAIEMTASKAYSPSTWTDFGLLLIQDVEVEVPASFEITGGASGNHWSTLTLGDLECRYQGRGDTSNADVGSGQWLKGNGYDLSSCEDGSGAVAIAAGQVVTVAAGETIELQVANGAQGDKSNPSATEIAGSMDVSAWR